jgi:hypothetical protein
MKRISLYLAQIRGQALSANNLNYCAARDLGRLQPVPDPKLPDFVIS